MRCIYCGGNDSKVLDSRPSEDGFAIRRRRECTTCKKRFTTYEKIEENSKTIRILTDTIEQMQQEINKLKGINAQSI